MKKTQDMRREYAHGHLNKKSVAPNPFRQFEIWFEEAAHADLVDANAMTLATSSPDGQPSARIVLLKSFDENGFVFFGNYGSRKGLELKANPFASLLFYWREFERQVRIEGVVERISREASEEYFRSRPFESQVAAVVSIQSAIIPNRDVLEQKFKQLLSGFEGKEVPMPSNWGGYLLVPEQFEFWQGGKYRLHDRIRYAETGDGWTIERLAP